MGYGKAMKKRRYNAGLTWVKLEDPQVYHTIALSVLNASTIAGPGGIQFFSHHQVQNRMLLMNIDDLLTSFPKI